MGVDVGQGLGMSVDVGQGVGVDGSRWLGVILAQGNMDIALNPNPEP
jgi:hypothetical protein